ncbi:MAG: DUF5082 domain-containing protein [Candidatus Bipolaricaulota bacterium]|nr:DUF5082 domain-containing protein [Candidatus Bipolaricaulota bacterium]
MHRHHARAHAASHAECCAVTPWSSGDCGCGTEHRSCGCCGCCCCCCCCHGHHGECSCGPEGGYGFRRRFVSRGERISRLEAYLAELQAEAQAVQEEIARLRKGE